MTEARAERAQVISRIKLVALIVVFAGPLALASIWYKLTDPQSNIDTRNAGELIDPARPLEPFSIASRDGSELSLEQLKGRWTLIYFAGEHCGSVCEQNIYHMRQVRTSLHKEMHRLQRLYVGPELSDAQLTEYPLMMRASDEAKALTAQVESALSAAQMQPLRDAMYLVDPIGNLMMRFDPELDPRDMLKDIKHLLKVSRIG